PDIIVVAYPYRDENAPWRIAVAPLEGGEPLKTFDLPPTFGVPLRWTPDGRALAYIDTRGGVSNIFAQPLDGGAPKPLTDFKADRIFWFDFSRERASWRPSREKSNQKMRSALKSVSGFGAPPSSVWAKMLETAPRVSMYARA